MLSIGKLSLSPSFEHTPKACSSKNIFNFSIIGGGLVSSKLSKKQLKCKIAFPHRMFKKIFLLFMISWSIQAQEKTSEIQSFRFLSNVSISPVLLQLKGDSIRFSIKGMVPNESFLTPRNPRLRLRMHSSLNSLDLGDIVLKKRLGNFLFEREFSLFFEPWMEAAVVELNFFHGSKRNTQPYESRILSKGISAPQLLISFDNSQHNEFQPLQLGLFQLLGKGDSQIQRQEEFSLVFKPGSPQLLEGNSNEESIQNLKAFVNDHPNLVEVKITGIQSPEQVEGRNSQLGMKRAEAAGEKIKELLFDYSAEGISYEARRNDWFDLRQLLADYSGISEEDKERMYLVLLGEGNYLDKWERLKKLPGYPRVSRDLFPLLRSAKIEITATGMDGLTMEKSIRIRRFLKGLETSNELSIEDWARAAEASQGLEQKIAIYSKMAELFPSSELPLLNNAVLRIRQVQESFVPDSRETLLDEADRLLEMAFSINPTNPFTLHNIGVVYLLRGLNWEAYKKLSEAIVLSADPRFIESTEVLRGALDILRGDYKLATLRFGSNLSDPIALFYKGLANYLVGNYEEASRVFEESVIRGRELGFGYYGLALIAGHSGLSEIAVQHLQKAIFHNRKFAEKIFFDPNFQEIRNNPNFFNELKIN
jgi:tetratricopeptide (TPR) repeat protein